MLLKRTSAAKYPGAAPSSVSALICVATPALRLTAAAESRPHCSQSEVPVVVRLTTAAPAVTDPVSSAACAGDTANSAAANNASSPHRPLSFFRHKRQPVSIMFLSAPRVPTIGCKRAADLLVNCKD